jgi:hypothetical protein
MSTSRQDKKKVRERAGNCCEYCRLSASGGTIPFHVDHISSIKYGGKDTLDNLCFACYPCNSYKGSNIAAADPKTGEAAFLFNPRRHNWDEHFQINANATLMGLTPEGRTTIVTLRINDERRVEHRLMLMELGDYPCEKED